ncbi:benzoate 4-monooxygenase cytochrome P450 [Xylogone sp. PMI_703]|nr:benzoate 4-monooxygenase cytochrome P450 [Xylogone sp. PMI_703]
MWNNETSQFLAMPRAEQLELFANSISSPLVSACVLASVLLFITTYIRDPLRTVPGPFLAKFNKLYLIYYTCRLRRHLDDLELHKKYGPVVRLAPHEVAISSPSALSVIYGAGTSKKFLKSDWYSLLKRAGPEDLDLMAENDMDKYRLQRRLVGPIYSQSSMKDHEPQLDAVLSGIIEKMHQLSGKSFDIDTWCNMIAADCLSASTFSEPRGFVDSGVDDGSIEAKHNFWKVVSWAGYYPRFHWFNQWLIAKTGYGIQSKLIKPYPLFAWATGKFQARKQEAEGKNPPDLAQKLVDLNRTNPAFKDQWASFMNMTNFGAGVETIGLSLASVIFEITRDPVLVKRVQDEIKSSRDKGLLSDPPKLGELEQHLPLTHACLQESLRLYPAIGTTLPRVLVGPGIEVEGHFLPSGTIVGINPWVLARDTSIYGKDAIEFRPDRWLEMSEQENKRIQSYSMVFGLGSRSCPGKHLALSILHKTLPALLMHFDWILSDPSAKHEYLTAFTTSLETVMMEWQTRTN